MDIVITYVDGRDPLWREDFSKYAGRADFERRFRDWDTLRYLFRGIEVNMPFIRKVHLVVSGQSQVPSWIDRDKVHIVLHEDIIPGEYLPTFNSTAIEMFLHRIDGLDEEYIYFNDDIFPVRPIAAEDFFEDGCGCDGMSVCRFATNAYRKQARNASNVARIAAGLPATGKYLRAQHCASPMSKSACAELYDRASHLIRPTITRTRKPCNLNQYVFLDYMYFKGLLKNRRQSCRHFSLAVASAERIARWLGNPDRNLVCINDVDMSDRRFEKSSHALRQAFESLFPDKSRFEL